MRLRADNSTSVTSLQGPARRPPSQPASMLGIWGTFSSVVFYLTLAMGLGGLLGTVATSPSLLKPHPFHCPQSQPPKPALNSRLYRPFSSAFKGVSQWKR